MTIIHRLIKWYNDQMAAAWRKLRTWNPTWFVNPFFSPALFWIDAMTEAGRAFAKGLEAGRKHIEDGGEFTGFSPEVWGHLQRSAATITFGYQEDEDTQEQ